MVLVVFYIPCVLVCHILVEPVSCSTTSLIKPLKWKPYLNECLAWVWLTVTLPAVSLIPEMQTPPLLHKVVITF